MTGKPAVEEEIAPDLWGRILYDCFRGKEVRYRLVFVPYHEVEFDAREYLELRFSDHERLALSYVRGPVLDVGVGAGRHLLWAQAQGHEVTGIDVSPLAVRVCQERGLVDTRLMSIFEPDLEVSRYNAVLVMGNNMGMGGDSEKTRALLANVFRASAPGAVLVGSFVPMDYVPDEEWPPEGMRSRHRIEYAGRTGPFFDWLFFKTSQLRSLAEGQGWQVQRVLRGADIQSYLIAYKPLDGLAEHLGLPEREVVADLWDQALRRAMAGGAVEVAVEGPGAVRPAAFDPERTLAPSPIPAECSALEHVKGRVFELGCGGGGRLAYLRDRGHPVSGEDRSPAAVECACGRGLPDVNVGSLDSLGYRPGSFDTILLLSGQPAAAGDLPGVAMLLRALRVIAAPGARLLVSFETCGASSPAILRLVVAGRAGEWFRWARFPDAACVEALLAEAGWLPVERFPLPGDELLVLAERSSLVVDDAPQA